MSNSTQKPLSEKQKIARATKIQNEAYRAGVEMTTKKLKEEMSNSTQNKCPFCNSELISLVLPSYPPQYKTYCPNCENSKVSNSTQKNEIKQMEKAINEGFAESEKDLKNEKTPFDKPTQNDNETLDSKFSIPNDELYTKQELDKAVADARREMIDKVEKLNGKDIEYWMKKLNVPVSDYAYGHKRGYELAIDEVLATLKEEES